MTKLVERVARAIAIGGENPDVYGEFGKAPAAIAIVLEAAAKVVLCNSFNLDGAEKELAAAIRALGDSHDPR